MVLYIENPKDGTLQNLLEIINKFSKATGYIKIQKSLAFLFTHSELSERQIDITFSFLNFLKLEDNCFTKLCWFLQCISMNQPPLMVAIQYQV